MSTCAKRDVIQVGDRPARVKKAALAVQAAAQALQQRQLPATGQRGMPSGAGRPINHGGLGGADPLAKLARALEQLARETADAFRAPQGPVGHSGGRQPNTGSTNVGNGSGTTGANGTGAFTQGAVMIGTYEAPYTEPMFIPLPPNFTPAAVIAARIIAPTDITRYFRSGVGCDAIPYGNRMLLRSIDGMTIGDPTVLHYTFIYYGSQD
jgi:hypothetical protein